LKQNITRKCNQNTPRCRRTSKSSLNSNAEVGFEAPTSSLWSGRGCTSKKSATDGHLSVGRRKKRRFALHRPRPRCSAGKWPDGRHSNLLPTALQKLKKGKAKKNQNVWATNSLSDVDLQPTLGLRASGWGFQRRPPLKRKKENEKYFGKGKVQKAGWLKISGRIFKMNSERTKKCGHSEIGSKMSGGA
jgi:hypothetical protein